MIALQFGSGNIGRGFIGALLSQSGYEVYFLDINDTLINELNKKNQYTIELADDEQKEITISNVKGIHSEKEKGQAIKLISQADLITTAVGPNNLKRIAPIIADGLKIRFKQTAKSMNIIACENMVSGSSILKEQIQKWLNSQEKIKLDQYVGFPNSAVDRIVPLQNHEDPLKVSVEPFFEWIVEKQNFRGELPEIKGMTSVNDLTPYIERKLYTVNTGHASVAYLGYYKNINTIDKAVADPFIHSILKGTLQETGELLCKSHQFDRSKHEMYIQKIIKRFTNKRITDDVTRVARNPIRKLGENDRLVAPAKRLMAYGKSPEYLATVIASVLLYDFNGDQEAIQLQETIRQNGVLTALSKYSNLNEDDPLTKLILQKYEQLKERSFHPIN